MKKLSDITKHCDDLGFVPIEKILKLHPIKNINKERLMVIEANLRSNPNVDLLEYWIIKRLIEWDFDI